MATERCRFTPSVRGEPSRGRASCWRPTYGETGRCVWHAPSAAKSPVDLATAERRPGERLDGADLSGLAFDGVDWFADLVLLGADFDDANVDDADFSGADLRKSSFHDASARGTAFRATNLEGADLGNADLRDADLLMAKVDDVNVSGTRIDGETGFGWEAYYEREMKRSADPGQREDALEAAVRTYRTVEDLSQDNSLYRQASVFYRKAKDVRRRYNWQQRNRVAALGGEASRWVAGYGSDPWRVLATGAAVVLASAVAYPLLGGLEATGTDTLYAFGHADAVGLERGGFVLLQSVYFSVVTFTTLGYGNLDPASQATQYVAGVEAILGSIIMALLVAVLTRSTWLR